MKWELEGGGSIEGVVGEPMTPLHRSFNGWSMKPGKYLSLGKERATEPREATGSDAWQFPSQTTAEQIYTPHVIRRVGP